MTFQMGFGKTIAAAMMGSVMLCNAQVVASHAPTLVVPKPANSTATMSSTPAPASPGIPVARVNGAVLTDEDLMREIEAIFPYAKIHNGMPKTEVRDKARVTEATALAYYKANPENFQRPEMFGIQTISVIPPQNPTPDMQQEAKKKAENAVKQAKSTKTYQEFGLLAEKISEDDWHVNMGDRKSVEWDKLPPPVVTAALAMKPGQVSDLIQLGPAYTLFRLNAHVPAGIAPFPEVKAKLMSDMQKSKTDQLRAELNKRLRKTARIEVL